MNNQPVARSIGIIGGADGPTAIYVTTQLSPTFTITVASLIIAFVGYCIYKILKKKKK